MLDLNSPRWEELVARGSPLEVPKLLRRLEADPKQVGILEDNVWYYLWDALHHQGDIFQTSYAAVPHIVRIGLQVEADTVPVWEYFGLPTTIETIRLRHGGPEIPLFVREDYFRALSQLHDLAYHFAAVAWPELLIREIAAALAVSKGHVTLTEAYSVMTPADAEDFLVQQGWRYRDDEIYLY